MYIKDLIIHYQVVVYKVSDTTTMHVTQVISTTTNLYSVGETAGVVVDEQTTIAPSRVQ